MSINPHLGLEDQGRTEVEPQEPPHSKGFPPVEVPSQSTLRSRNPEIAATIDKMFEAPSHAGKEPNQIEIDLDSAIEMAIEARATQVIEWLRFMKRRYRTQENS